MSNLINSLLAINLQEQEDKEIEPIHNPKSITTPTDPSEDYHLAHNRERPVLCGAVVGGTEAAALPEGCCGGGKGGQYQQHEVLSMGACGKERGKEQGKVKKEEGESEGGEVTMMELVVEEPGHGDLLVEEAVMKDEERDNAEQEGENEVEEEEEEYSDEMGSYYSLESVFGSDFDGDESEEDDLLNMLPVRSPTPRPHLPDRETFNDTPRGEMPFRVGVRRIRGRIDDTTREVDEEDEGATLNGYRWEDISGSHLSEQCAVGIPIAPQQYLQQYLYETARKSARYHPATRMTSPQRGLGVGEGASGPTREQQVFKWENLGAGSECTPIGNSLASKRRIHISRPYFGTEKRKQCIATMKKRSRRPLCEGVLEVIEGDEGDMAYVPEEAHIRTSSVRTASFSNCTSPESPNHGGRVERVTSQSHKDSPFPCHILGASGRDAVRASHGGVRGIPVGHHIDPINGIPGEGSQEGNYAEGQETKNNSSGVHRLKRHCSRVVSTNLPSSSSSIGAQSMKAQEDSESGEQVLSTRGYRYALQNFSLEEMASLF
eukprot:Nk52_evm83s158 gene=Nk52_evmTU83s158